MHHAISLYNSSATLLRSMRTTESCEQRDVLALVFFITPVEVTSGTLTEAIFHIVLDRGLNSSKSLTQLFARVAARPRAVPSQPPSSFYNDFRIQLHITEIPSALSSTHPSTR